MEECKCNKPDCKKCQQQKLQEVNKTLTSSRLIRQLAIKKPIRQLAADSVRAQTICLDFDGVIAEYAGWKGKRGEIGKPIEGFKEFLDEANREGYIVIIHSARDSVSIDKWLKENDIKCPVSVEKPMACIYVDDNALRFDGSYIGLLNKIKQHKPWWKKEE